ncbi:MAG: DNA translocase FtsK 4TM domain-containing protein, partial [Pseudomonadota bacterium]
MSKPFFSQYERDWLRAIARVIAAAALALFGATILLSLLSYHPQDPGLFSATWRRPENWLGAQGALIADLLHRSIGVAGYGVAALALAWSLRVRRGAWPAGLFWRVLAMPCALLAVAALASSEPELAVSGGGLGGLLGDILFKFVHSGAPFYNEQLRYIAAVGFLALITPPLAIAACGGGVVETVAWFARGMRDMQGAVVTIARGLAQTIRAVTPAPLWRALRRAFASGPGLATAGAAAGSGPAASAACRSGAAPGAGLGAGLGAGP